MEQDMETDTVDGAIPHTNGIDKGKPLYTLIQNLINVSNTESSTMVENSQLLDILRVEFSMPTDKMDSLDVDIYMNVLKRFLKTWPCWDEFDTIMRENKDHPAKREGYTLEEYKRLKEYLQRVLDYTKTQMQPILQKMEVRREKQQETYRAEKDTISNGEYVMEVCCSREQLNRLFFRQPHPQTLTIFNITDEPGQSKISLNEITFKEVLNWPNITIKIMLPNFEYLRVNSSHFERTLINRKLPQKNTSSQTNKLSKQMYVKSASLSAKKKTIKKTVILSYFDMLINYIKEQDIPNDERKENLVHLFTEIQKDLTNMNNLMSLGAEYQYFLSKYNYIRLLSSTDYPKEKSNSTSEALKECINPNDFDLHLEEKISPTVKFELAKFSVPYNEDKVTGFSSQIDYTCFLDATSNWLRFECSWCEYKCDGFLAIYHIVLHLNTHHSFEPDWQCTHCEKKFTMMHLCSHRWAHVHCQKQ